jgi:hypothetical protein
MRVCNYLGYLENLIDTSEIKMPSEENSVTYRERAECTKFLCREKYSVLAA